MSVSMMSMRICARAPFSRRLSFTTELDAGSLVVPVLGGLVLGRLFHRLCLARAFLFADGRQPQGSRGGTARIVAQAALGHVLIGPSTKAITPATGGSCSHCAERRGREAVQRLPKDPTALRKYCMRMPDGSASRVSSLWAYVVQEVPPHHGQYVDYRTVQPHRATATTLHCAAPLRCLHHTTL